MKGKRGNGKASSGVISVRVSPELQTRLNKFCVEHFNASIGMIVTTALEEFLHKRAKDSK